MSHTTERTHGRRGRRPYPGRWPCPSLRPNPGRQAYLGRCLAWLLLAQLAVGALAAAPAKPPEPWRWAGPLRWTNAHPFHAIFLDTPALDAELPSKPVFDASISHFNTIALSNNVFTTAAGAELLAHAPHGAPKVPLDMASLAATAQTRPTEAFQFADTETTRLDLTWLQPLSRRWAFQADVPIIGHTGGILDQFVEFFHRATGFGKLNRQYAPRDLTQLFFARGNDVRTFTGPFEPSLGDIVLRGFYQPLREAPGQPAVMVSTALKLPTGATRPFYGSGGWDGGLGLHVAKALGDFRLNLTLGQNWHGHWKGMRGVPIRDTFDLSFGGEARMSSRWSALLQFQRQEHALAAAAPDTFGHGSWTIGTGFAWHANRRLLMQADFFENLTEDNNTYDVGVNYRLRWNL